jgi:drug/metabolite transporter (DMT)-like permease
VESGLAALLVSSEPLWIVVLSWLLPGGRRPSLPVIAGLSLGFIGVGLLVKPGGSTTVDPVGAAMLVLAALSWAYGSLWGIKAKAPDSPLLMTGMQMLAGGALQLLAATARGEVTALDPSQVTMRSVLAVAYLMVFGSLVGFTAYSWLMRVAPPVLVSTYAYVNPVVAVVLGWAIASEPLTLGTLVAAAIILGGVALITSSQARGSKKAEEAKAEPEGVPLPALATTE